MHATDRTSRRNAPQFRFRSCQEGLGKRPVVPRTDRPFQNAFTHITIAITRSRREVFNFQFARLRDSGALRGYARHGRDCYGVQVPCTSLRVLRRSAYQMIPPIDKVRDEGNCGRATDRGEEACGCVGKRRVCESPPGHVLVKAARLRTETPYKAGSGRRVSTTSRSRSQTPAQVNGELVQRNITLLSGETCQAACESSFAPMSKACLKGGNVAEQSTTGEAGVSRGRSTDPRRPIETGRTER